MKLLECRSLRLGYGANILPPCPDFAVGAGECLCVTGSNGTGKTTLLKCIAGLESPLGGIISMAEGLSRGGVGYVPQQAPMQHDFPASVREVVLSGRQARRGWRPFYTAEDRRCAAAAMERLGVAGLEKRCYRELSGGQRQRVLIARALCGECRLVLLDEPTNGLDETAAKSLCQTVREVNAAGVATVMVTHDRSAALAVATHILKLGGEASFRRVDSHG